MMMKLQDIPRVKAGHALPAASKGPLDSLDQERLYLATRAADLLGYRLLTGEVTGERRVGVSEGKLTDTLQALGYEVLDAEAVIDYQMAEAGRRTKELILERFSDWTTGWFNIAAWAHTSLTEYERPVPEFVLDKAIKIKEACPNVHFEVQHLNDPKADPFLIAKLGKEIYYLEGWDEPRFEGRFAGRAGEKQK